MAVSQKHVALVSGSTSGIGLGIARKFASFGYDIIITGLGEQNVIDDIQKEFKQNYKGDCTYVYADFTKQDEIQAMCETIVKKYPNGIDILVNNAGFQFVDLIEDYPIDKWNDIIAVHLTSAFLLTRFFLPFMKKKGWGRIVNHGSPMGIVSTPTKVPYTVAKAGLIGLTKGTAVETAAYGITCNIVCPAMVETELVVKQINTLAKEQNKTYEEKRNDLINWLLPTKKPVTVEQIAVFVSYLCSDDASSMTGSVVSMDGGFTAL
ncbi:hypothetical protein ACF0H5_009910 [Mactra antiquata]